MDIDKKPDIPYCGIYGVFVSNEERVVDDGRNPRLGARAAYPGY